VKFKIKYVKNKGQQEFDSDILTKILHMNGGYGSGKSYGLVQKCLKLSYLNRHIPGGLVVPSIPEYKKDVLPIIEEILDANHIPHRYNKSEKVWRFPWSRAPMQIVTAERKIKGPNWGWAGINEVTLISIERFREVLGRVRIKNTPYPQIAMSGTPEGFGHWLHELLIEKPITNSRVIYADTRDNAHNLADDYIPTLEASYDEISLAAYLKGLWVNMNAARFYYAYDPAKQHDESIVRKKGEEVYVTLDFNVSPMCATLWHIRYVKSPTGHLIYGLDEQPMEEVLGFDQIEIKDGADTYKMSDAMYARGLEPDSTTIYPDPAGKNRSTQSPLSDIDILKKCGWNKIQVKIVAPQFRKRQLCVNNLLDKALIKFNPNTCPGIKKDLQAVEQDPATLEKLKENKSLTHYSDGLDYMCDIRYPMSGTKPVKGGVRIR
jgi:hypothetical protein